MKVVLRDDVENIGRKGDLIEVTDGFARNFLVPRGLAMKATKGVVQQAEAMRRNREARDVRDREAAQALADQLTGKRPRWAPLQGQADAPFPGPPHDLVADRDVPRGDAVGLEDHDVRVRLASR